MLDRTLMAWLGPGLDRSARVLRPLGVHADRVSGLGFALGSGAAAPAEPRSAPQ